MKTTIAIQFGNGFKAIKAEKLDIHGIPCAVHKAPSGNGWNVTFIQVGLAAVSHQRTKAYAIEYATDRIVRTGTDKVQALLLKQKTAPPVEGLEEHVRVIEEKTTVDVESIIAELAKRADVSAAVVKRIICPKGKNTGRLIAKCPPVFGPKADTEGAAVWLGLQPNPYKVSVGKVLFLPRELQETCTRLAAIKWPSWLDSDRANLESFGVW